MRLVKPIIRNLFVALTLINVALSAQAQENSPFSRYGLGDLVPNQNINSRGMGGISAAYIDVISPLYPNLQSINITNPASLGFLSKYSMKDSTGISINYLNMLFDVGGEVDWRTLKSTAQAEKFTSVNALISYVSIAFPVASQKMNRKGINWAMAIGLKPQTRVNYRTLKSERLTGIDSLQTLYEGSGGTNQAYLSSGWRFILNGKGNKPQTSISAGLTAGYTFGNKDYATKINFLNDTVTYAAANYATRSNFGGMYFNGGLQFEKQFADTSALRIGVYGNLQRNLNSTSNLVRETYTLDGNSNELRIDSVFENNNQKGTVVYPASLGAGITYQNNVWLFGADFETTNWANYRFNGLTDLVQNNWIVRAGAQYTPKPSKRYLSQGRYRAGFFYGPDYVKVGTSKPYYAVTAGASLPLTSPLQLRYGNYATLHTSLEVGGRGNKQNSLRESFVRFSLGITMSARWFQKPKYD